MERLHTQTTPGTVSSQVDLCKELHVMAAEHARKEEEMRQSSGPGHVDAQWPPLAKCLLKRIYAKACTGEQVATCFNKNLEFEGAVRGTLG